MQAKDRYVELYNRVYARRALVRTLSVLGKVSVVLVGAAYVYALIVLFWFAEFESAVKLVAFTAIPFIVVSFMRSFIDCKRPYEVFECEALKEATKGRKSGHSFPSRHVFSAFIIGTLWLMYSPYIGAAVLTLGVFLAVTRVLLGIHFTKDVIVGALIGTLSGLIGTLIW